jgi:hypothetical protein
MGGEPQPRQAESARLRLGKADHRPAYAPRLRVRQHRRDVDIEMVRPALRHDEAEPRALFFGHMHLAGSAERGVIGAGTRPMRGM